MFLNTQTSPQLYNRYAYAYRYEEKGKLFILCLIKIVKVALMAKRRGYYLDKTGSRCRSSDGKYAPCEMCPKCPIKRKR